MSSLHSRSLSRKFYLIDLREPRREPGFFFARESDLVVFLSSDHDSYFELARLTFKSLENQLAMRKIILLSLLTVVGRLQAQTFPFHWNRVQVCRPCEPSTFTFIDSMRGMLITKMGFNSMKALSTSNGGQSFQPVDCPSCFAAIPNLFHDFSVTKPNLISYFSSSGAVNVTTNLGVHWIRGGTTINTLGGKMLSPTEGISTAIANFQEAELRFTHDTTYRFFERTSTISLGLAQDALILDSSNAWILFASSGQPVLAHTTNSGNTWDTLRPTGESTAKYRAHNVLRGASDDRIFLLSGILDSTDYLFSTNGGKSWDERSSTRNRIYRLVETEPNILWAIVGHRYLDASQDLMGAARSKSTPKRFADSVFYSTDGGVSWLKDGDSFEGDTIVAMSWPDPKHGYVLSIKDSAVFLSSINLSQLAVENKRVFSNKNLNVYPNPTQGKLHFTLGNASGKAIISVVDVLGKTVRRNIQDLNPNEQSTLTLPEGTRPGAYFFIVKSASDTQGSWFILEP
jgi:hypothetical protein